MGRADDFGFDELRAQLYKEIQYTFDRHFATLTTQAAMARRLAEHLADVVGLANVAMGEANNDGADYDRDECLKDAREVLAAYEASTKGKT